MAKPSAGTAANNISCNKAHSRLMTTPQIPQRHRHHHPDAGRQRQQAGHRPARQPGVDVPLNISATALISGKPGTSNSTLAAIATLEVSLNAGRRSSPEIDVATNAVRQN